MGFEKVDGRGLMYTTGENSRHFEVLMDVRCGDGDYSGAVGSCRLLVFVFGRVCGSSAKHNLVHCRASIRIDGSREDCAKKRE
jgi:hypothetical protein